MDQRSLFGLSEHLERLSEVGDPLEALEAAVDFEYFRPWLLEGLGYGDGRHGGRPPYDPVAMFKVLILQTQHNLSDARTEFMLQERLSWMRFAGFDLGQKTPDENTIRLFRNRLTESGGLKRVMKAFDWQLHKKGYLPMSGQIVDASLVPAPSSATLKASGRPSRRERPRRRYGRISLPKPPRRTPVLPSLGLQANHCRAMAGPSRSGARSAIARTACRCRRSRSRCLATSRISPLIGGSASSAAVL